MFRAWVWCLGNEKSLYCVVICMLAHKTPREWAWKCLTVLPMGHTLCISVYASCLWKYFLSMTVLPVWMCSISGWSRCESCDGCVAHRKRLHISHGALICCINQTINKETTWILSPLPACHHFPRLLVFLVNAQRQMFPWRQTNTMVAKLLPVSMEIWYVVASDLV